jgi:secretion/DNA translocation related CpaE-like protein
LPAPLPTSRPLLVTADADLLDVLLRLAASAAVEVDVAADPGAARRSWTTAPLVVVGHDLVPACMEAGLTRRSGVVLIGDDLDDAGVWQRAVTLGAEQVVLLPDGEAWLVAALGESQEGRQFLGPVVSVIGGRGGAGATTLACALALTASRRGVSTVLIDGDPWGGGLDMVFGGELRPGLRWPDLATTRGRLPGRVLADALPLLHGVPVLSCGRGEMGDMVELPPLAVTAVLTAAQRSAELVVVDLPRSSDEATTAIWEASTTTLLVVPAEVRAAASAARVASRVALHCQDVRVVVRGPAPGGLAPADVARALGLPLVGTLRAEPSLDAALERGEPPGTRARSPLAVLCTALIDDVLGVGTRRAA